MGDGLGIRIDQEFVAVKAMTICRIEFTFDLVAIELPCLDGVDKDMPYKATVTMKRDNIGRFAGIRFVEQEKPNLCGMPAEDGKIHSIPTERSTDWMISPG